MADKIKIKKPKEKDAVRYGKTLEVVIDASVSEPWFKLPRFGQKIPSVTGESHRGLDFKAPSPKPVKSVTAGTAKISDTGIDDHSGQGKGNRKAGRGYEVIVKSGDFSVHYGHLKRNTGKSGKIRVGDILGQTGNTGRCLNGCDGTFAHFEVRKGSLAQDLNAVSRPVQVHVEVNGKSLGNAVDLPPGEVDISGLKVGRYSVKKSHFSKAENELTIHLKRGSKVLAKQTMKVPVAIG
jgi:murein DD-endopeptidase MepM/ murein hydrolase activator NlpD